MDSTRSVLSIHDVVCFYCNLVIINCLLFFFFFKQKTAYEMRISDWSSDVCSSDLLKSLPRKRDHGADASVACGVQRLLRRLAADFDHFLRAPKLVDLAYVARDVDHQFRRIQRQLPARDLRLHGVQRARHGVDHAGLARWVAQAPVEPAPQPDRT